MRKAAQNVAPSVVPRSVPTVETLKSRAHCDGDGCSLAAWCYRARQAPLDWHTFVRPAVRGPGCEHFQALTGPRREEALQEQWRQQAGITHVVSVVRPDEVITVQRMVQGCAIGTRPDGSTVTCHPGTWRGVGR